MITYNLLDLLRDSLSSDSTDLVTRSTGEAVRLRIEKKIEQEPGGIVIALDFSDIAIIDYSCADEIVAKIMSRLIGGEYSDRYILLTGLNENQRENIEVALERKELAAITIMRNGERTLIGRLNNYLGSTLELIENKEKITAKDISEIMGLESNTSGTRLLNLHKKRLVKRREDKMSGSRIWIYEKIT